MASPDVSVVFPADGRCSVGIVLEMIVSRQALAWTACQEGRSQVCSRICVALAEVRRRIPSLGLHGTREARNRGPLYVGPTLAPPCSPFIRHCAAHAPPPLGFSPQHVSVPTDSPLRRCGAWPTNDAYRGGWAFVSGGGGVDTAPQAGPPLKKQAQLTPCPQILPGLTPGPWR